VTQEGHRIASLQLEILGLMLSQKNIH